MSEQPGNDYIAVDQTCSNSILVYIFVRALKSSDISTASLLDPTFFDFGNFRLSRVAFQGRELVRSDGGDAFLSSEISSCHCSRPEHSLYFSEECKHYTSLPLLPVP